MNQEEWLRMRRELGLPADPEKDFPPGFRQAPRLDSDAQLRSARGSSYRTPRAPELPRQDQPKPLPTLPPPTSSGPGFAAPSTPKTLPNPFANAQRRRPLRNLGLRLLIPLSILLITGLLPVLIGGNKASNTGATAEMKQAAADFATSLVGGNLKDIEDSVSLPTGVDRSLLTPAQARKMYASKTDVTVSYASKSGGGTSGTASFTLPLADGTGDYTNVRLKLLGDTWSVDRMPLPVLKITGADDVTVIVDGVKLPPKKAGTSSTQGRLVAVWPGMHTVEAVGGRYVTFATPKQTLHSYISGYAYSSGNEDWINFTGRPSDAFKTDAQEAGLAAAKACAKRGALSDDTCPYTVSFGVPEAQLRNVKVTLQEPDTSTPSVDPAGASYRLQGSGPQVSATATSVASGTARSVTATPSRVYYNGIVSFTAGKLTYTQDGS